jgi:hypothetical protein
MRINFSQLSIRYRDITALDALELLCVIFGAGNAYINMDGKRLPLYELYNNSEIFNWKASEIDLDFFGGPKPAKWWPGTLLTLLLDHILYAYSINDLAKVHKALKAVV